MSRAAVDDSTGDILWELLKLLDDPAFCEALANRAKRIRTRHGVDEDDVDGFLNALIADQRHRLNMIGPTNPRRRRTRRKRR